MSSTERDDPSSGQTKPLRHYVGASLDQYFESLNGCEPPDNLYEMVLAEVEKPLLERVLDQTGGNQSRAAEMLGINRATLRKKLRRHALNG
ncbi:DNA-binding transcriptional regulator Fis [Salinisphaera sp. USBA-960]|uniref:DNA-binding transcriptional regulator Fis n=1 Tax=Salinisphaera orenii TaxID=856731 RepID=UPI000DBE54A1|nr:DNA-binding transcriptional regulator Fis [Salifodinibacter halophilus]NNC26945.1 DNA-binding transcriptional regulator Fis [Salifodinibacter halophilus]